MHLYVILNLFQDLDVMLYIEKDRDTETSSARQAGMAIALLFLRSDQK